MLKADRDTTKEKTIEFHGDFLDKDRGKAF